MGKEVDAVTRLYDLILWLIPKLERFPRSQKFLIGDRIESLMLDTLEQLIEASYSRQKTALLHQANLKLEVLRYLMPIAKINLPFLASFLSRFASCPVRDKRQTHY